MPDDVLLNKAATIERCVARAKEEYLSDPESFAINFTRQDAAILNIQRACEAALDMAQHVVRAERLGLPQSARDAFELLAASRVDRPRACRVAQKDGRLSQHRRARLPKPAPTHHGQHHHVEPARLPAL